MNRLETVQILLDLQVNHLLPASYWSVGSFPSNSQCADFFYPRLGDSDTLAPASSPGSPSAGTNSFPGEGCMV